MLVDQPLYDEKIYKNYVVPTYGPIPVFPKNSFATSFEAQNPYPYDPGKAIALLTSHGWPVEPKGVTSCIDAEKCCARPARSSSSRSSMRRAPWPRSS